MGLCCTASDGIALSDQRAFDERPGVRPGGPPRLSPGADAGPAAPRGAALILVRPNSAVETGGPMSSWGDARTRLPDACDSQSTDRRMRAR